LKPISGNILNFVKRKDKTMNKDALLKLIEDIVDSGIQMRDFSCQLNKTNGDYAMTISKKDKSEINPMNPLAQILNDNSPAWSVSIHDNNITLTVT